MNFYRFIDSQLQLEADAREALPYVHSQLRSVALSNTSTEI
jgi:hypothetical protein